MMLHFARVRRAGFTLIEIMIVIAIIAILAGIVVPNIMKARSEAEAVACQENCKAVFEAVQMARVRHSWQQLAEICGGWMRDSDGNERFYAESEELFEAGILSRDVRCPVANVGYFVWYSDDEWVSFSRDARSWEEGEYVDVEGVRAVVCNEGHSDLDGWCPVYDARLGAGFI